MIIQWASLSMGDNITAFYPITFPNSILYFHVKGNFSSTSGATCTYNDLSAYTGYISIIDLSQYQCRCTTTNVKCFFIGF